MSDIMPSPNELMRQHEHAALRDERDAALNHLLECEDALAHAQAEGAQAEAERDEAIAQRDRIAQELRMAVTALGWVKVAFRKIDQGTECTPAHCRAADAECAHERGMSALRRFDALTGQCCGGGRAPCAVHLTEGQET